MDSLFSDAPIVLDLPDAEITYFPAFFSREIADELYADLLQSIPWQQDQIKVYGKQHDQPRLTALFGNDGKPYSYSNIIMQPHPWNLLLLKIKAMAETVSETQFTSVLLNYYRDGKDSNGWHADNEKELGKNPVIASVSLGAARVFQLRHNENSDLKRNILLEHGSLLLMKGPTQHHWKHQIPKTAKPIGGRINLTFRVIQ
ncbi:alpha-ketoglutarate-dependent dioxygenase AlkB [Flavobacterium sp. CYK-4]|uniref:alpha-ketoglutarate-dependent dioxygenase AlkB family protein n=1 Tax=Flavobacterium lotistagni TaxID=2709660 RepID=UPI001408155E|nr:alpha-ketoglutarate-dependent dioxygenase AlkB [Flavobacterium lotistagni]NHM06371.1 alpha-ketoglutarate-dependent dioxygenase AlkB [Flavobacterium lotistagni]